MISETYLRFIVNNYLRMFLAVRYAYIDIYEYEFAYSLHPTALASTIYMSTNPVEFLREYLAPEIEEPQVIEFQEMISRP